ncbi:MAG: GPR endopeptidase [Clostridia bacterium]|nr:GPR endopeptidase [Clostridia bacterium]
MQFSHRSSELYAEFAVPGDTGTEQCRTLRGWPVRCAEHSTGRYHTLTAGDITALSARDRSRLAMAAADILQEYLQGAACVLVCGLGNRHLTADSLGANVCSRLSVCGELPGGRGFYSFCPGVPAVTGIPTDTLVRMAAQCVSADRIIAVDALCARSAANLSAVLQCSDTGLIPGSGASGSETAGTGAKEEYPPEISTRTMPCPVVTVGVPTVIRTTLPDGGDRKYLVTGSDTDHVVESWSAVIASALLRAIFADGK